MATIHFGIDSYKNTNKQDLENINRDKKKQYEAEVKKLVNIQTYNYNKNVKDKDAYLKDYMINEDGILISPYLEKNIELYVWDWDDTLIDINAYYRHSMNPNYIINTLPESEFFRDFPHHQYFKDLVLYLIKNGKRVGIASFGTYSIIKAYMERLFGLNKNPFHSRNMFASCQDIGCVRDYTNMPTNKNSYIRKIMDYYELNDYGKVVLFDDRPTNIADAARLGVIGVQIGELSEKTGKFFVGKDQLFGPKVMRQVEDKLLASCSDENLKQFTRFGSLGDRRIHTNLGKFDYYFGDELKPNFKTEHFTNNLTENLKHKNSKFKSNVSDIKSRVKKLKEVINKNKNERTNKKRQNYICDNTGCYGFYNKSVGLPPYDNSSNTINIKGDSNNNSNNNSNNRLNKLNNNKKTKESFISQCTSCQNQASSIVVLIAFLILVFMIAGLVYFG